VSEDSGALPIRRAALALGGAGVACTAALAIRQARRAYEGIFVAKHTFWDLLGPSAQDAFMELGRVQILRDGQYFMVEGERSDRICVVMEGWIKICTNSDHGLETVLDLLGPGEIVGEGEAIDQEPRQTSAVAKGMTKVVTVSGDRFSQIMNRHAEVTNVLLRVLIERLRNANQLRGSVHGGTRHRVTALVHQIARRYGIATSSGADEVSISNTPWTRTEFASWAGTSRGAATRAMTWLRAKEVIHETGHDIVVRWRKLRQALRELGQDRDD
jgi:CRP/FNR family transcriptional regulator, cyclic AMP receptor protein